MTFRNKHCLVKIKMCFIWTWLVCYISIVLKSNNLIKNVTFKSFSAIVTQQTNNPADTIRKHCLYILTKQTITYSKVKTVSSRNNFYCIREHNIPFWLIFTCVSLKPYIDTVVIQRFPQTVTENMKTLLQLCFFIRFPPQHLVLDHSNATYCS